MKRILLLFTLITLLTKLYAQNPPTIGIPENDTLFLGSGLNFLMIPEVNDGDEGVDQEITFTVTSSDPSVLEINDVAYTAGHTLAIVHVSEKGLSGTVTIDVEAADDDGSAMSSFDVFVGPYDNPGINFEIHDIIFWQQIVPLRSNPAFSMIAQDGVAPYSQIDLAGLNLSVYSDCQSAICTGTDFFTALYKGYVIPPATGDYYFYMLSGDQKSIGLSQTVDFDDAEVILHSGEGIGTGSGKEWKSVQVSLEAGKTYAIYGTHWNVHTLMGGMLWEGPGIEKEYIPGQYLSYVYDVVKPSAPQNFTLVNTGITDLRLKWTDATDDQGLDGYNIYVNGIQYNENTLRETEFQLSELSPGTDYCLVVTSVDLAGNESTESEIVRTKTYVSDDNAPNPPTSVEASIISDLALAVAWSGATDGETEIRGYNLYVDGVLYNTGGLIYEEGTNVLGLSPETSYMIEVEALDAGYNVSPKSTPVSFTTSAFDPHDTSISNKKGRLKVIMEPIGRSDGLGVNPNYKNGEFLNDPEQVRLIKELEVSALRWGALTANPLNFEDYIGTGKAMTFGRMMDFCNEIGAYTVICCGVEDATDWRTKPETFTNFLEYLGGGPETVYGAKRIEEGYTESLLEGSPGLVFEFGNEVWGGDSHDAQIGRDYTEYGIWCREMASLMKASEFFDSDKIYLTYSGRRPAASDSYGLYESLLNGDEGEVDWLAVSGYLGGNLNYAPEIDPGDSELEYYRNGIAEMYRNLAGLEETMDVILNTCGSLKPTYMYEANMTNSAYFGRLGQALIQTDYYASVIEKGGAIPTIFHLTGGEWKMVVPAQDYKKLPLFYTSKYYNKLCKGNALRSEFESSITSSNSPVGCHVYADGESYGVLMISRDFENDWTVQLDLPDELELLGPGTVTMYTITGDGYSAKEARVDSTVVTLSDSMLVKVPRYSMVVFGFEGSGVSVEDVPLGYIDYASAESVSVYALGDVEEYVIEGRGKLIFKAEVLPEDILSDAVIWSVESGGVEAVYSLMSYGFDLRGSGTCEGNGTIKVRASAWDNPEIFDEVEVIISGQGIDCGVGIDDPSGNNLRMYPNPAGDQLYVTGLPEGFDRLEVRDITGRLVLEKMSGGHDMQIDLAGLDAGLYFLRLSGKGLVSTLSFVKE